MSGIALCLVIAMADVGWEPDRQGNTEFIIQIAPADLESIAGGKNEIRNDIPPHLVGDVVRFRVRVGNDRLPKTDPPLRPQVAPHIQAVPHILSPDSNVRPVAGLAAMPTAEAMSPSNGDPPEPNHLPADTPDEPPEASKPWMPLTIVSFLALGFFSGMVYFGWTAWDIRHRYLLLLQGQPEAEPTAEM